MNEWEFDICFVYLKTNELVNSKTFQITRKRRDLQYKIAGRIIKEQPKPFYGYVNFKKHNN